METAFCLPSQTWHRFIRQNIEKQDKESRICIRLRHFNFACNLVRVLSFLKDLISNLASLQNAWDNLIEKNQQDFNRKLIFKKSIILKIWWNIIIVDGKVLFEDILKKQSKSTLVSLINSAFTMERMETILKIKTNTVKSEISAILL